MFVEDSNLIRNAIANELENAGYKVVQTFENGARAYDYMRAAINPDKGSPVELSMIIDAVVSDIEMPDMDGLTLCRKFREDLGNSTIPFVFFSKRCSTLRLLKENNAVSEPEKNPESIIKIIKIIISFPNTIVYLP